MTISLEKIAFNISFFRKQNNWTQQELADKLKISRSVIAKWENNIVTPDISSLLKLCEIFNIRLDHIVGSNFFHDDLLKEFKRTYSSYPKSFDDDVIELLEYLMTNPEFKKAIFRLKALSIKKQKSIHQLLTNIINQYEKL